MLLNSTSEDRLTANMTVQVSNLVKSYVDKKRGQVEAVKAVSFTANAGTVLGLLGLNGAGKTTTLRVICTILRPTGGSVLVNGFDVLKEADQVRSQLGYLPADTSLPTNITPREVLQFYGRLCKYPQNKLRSRVEQVIELLEMQTFADAYCQRLSTGQKRKVAFARAIVHDPPVLIFDEPSANLDVVTAVKIRELLRALRGENKCILLSTHNMTEAEKLCDDIVVIHDGRVMATGSLAQLRAAEGDRNLEEIFVSIASGNTERDYNSNSV